MSLVVAFLRACDRALGRVVGLVALAYHLLISKRLPRVCVYHPSCSRYARLVWAREGLFGGRSMVGARLARCDGGTFRGEDWPPGVAPEGDVPRELLPRMIDAEELERLDSGANGKLAFLTRRNT